MKKTACYEGETGIEVKTAVIALVPSMKKIYQLSLPTVEAICKYWMDKRRGHTQPLLRHLQVTPMGRNISVTDLELY